MPNTGNSGIFVMLRVFRQQLVRYQLAVSRLRNDIGKGTTTINPELPHFHITPVAVKTK